MNTEQISSGHYKINFNNRTVMVGNKLIDKGEWEVNLENVNIKEKLQQLFDDYHFSGASEASSSKRFSYFKAASDKELSLGQTVLNGNRCVNMFELERFMLSVIVNKKWEDVFTEKVFYKGNNGLVVLKNWFEE